MNEMKIVIDSRLVALLIAQQCPKWQYLNVSHISSSGTDNELFRLGSNYLFRLRRPGKVITNIRKEYIWAPLIAKLLPYRISEPIFMGEPSVLYPYPWLIHNWIEGYTPEYEHREEYSELAVDMACFLNSLHEVSLPGGPLTRLGKSLKDRDEMTRIAINELSRDVKPKCVLELWNYLLTFALTDGTSAWVHGDLLPTNLLIKNNRLSAVLDLTDIGMGDPACDLVIAWSLFSSTSRAIFKENLSHIDDMAWQRGKGWALSVAVVVLSIYKHKNIALATIANTIINNIVSDHYAAKLDNC